MNGIFGLGVISLPRKSIILINFLFLLMGSPIEFKMTF